MIEIQKISVFNLNSLDKNDFIRDRAQDLLRHFSMDVPNSRLEINS